MFLSHIVLFAILGTKLAFGLRAWITKNPPFLVGFSHGMVEMGGIEPPSIAKIVTLLRV